MKVDNPHLELVRSMISLSGKSARQHSIDCGVVYTNFSAALRGNRSFPEDKWPVLLAQLGIPNLQLDAERVAFWQVGADLAPLKLAMKSFFPHGAKFEGVWRAGGGVWDMRRVMDNVLFAITDSKYRVILKRGGAGFMVHLNPDPVTPETVPQLSWRTGKPSVESMISIQDDQYEKWTLGDITPSEFDAAWYEGHQAVSWEQVTAYALERNLSPEQVLAILKSFKG